MWIRTVLLVLSLVVLGTYGCGPTLLQVAHDAAPALPIGQSQPIEPSATEAHLLSMPPPASADLNQHQEDAGEDVFTPTAIPSRGSASRTIEKKPARPENQEKQVKVQGGSPTALQEAPGPRADDRLLDLVGKDLDKAVEQVTERRRLEFSKAVIEHPKVRYFIRYFSKTGKNYFEKLLARSGKYMPMISKVLREEGLPEELAYLALIESGFFPHARSPRGAAGLWQFVPSTARLYGLRIDSWVDERRDPEKSTRAAAAYLKDLHGYFGRWYLVTAAYNAGQGRIDRAMQKTGANDFWGLGDKAKLSQETRNFVPKFVAASLIATDPKKYGFDEFPYESPLEYAEAEVESSLRLEAVAQMTESTLPAIRELNPALLRNATPPGDRRFLVKIPADKVQVFAKAYHQQKESESAPAQVVTHEVKKGETLVSIARRYRQRVSALIELNGLTHSRLRVGQTLKVMLKRLGGGLR